MTEIGSANGKGTDLGGSNHEPTSGEYLQMVLRGKWVILVTLVSILAVTVTYNYVANPVYEATASVLVDTRGQGLTSTLFDFSGLGGMKTIKNELEILKSNALAEVVARKLLDKEYCDEDEKIRIEVTLPGGDEVPGEEGVPLRVIVKRLSHAVEFYPVRDADVIRIIARSKHPKEAALIANVYAEAYYDRNMYASRARSRAVREFLDEQMRMKRESLMNAEEALQTYMEEKGVVLLDEEAKKLIEQLAQLEAMHDAADVGIQTTTKTLASYRKQLDELEPSVAKAIGDANDPYIRLLQDQIAKLEVQRDVTVAQNPQAVGQELYREKLEEIDEQIAALRLKLRDRTETYLETVVPGIRNPGQTIDPAGFLSQVKQKVIELQIELQELQSRKGALADQIDQYEAQFDRIPMKSIQFARLQRQQLSSEKLYLLVEQKFNEAAITEKSDFGYIDIIDPAVTPLEPVSPRKWLNIVIGVIVGLGIGMGLIFYREKLDVRVRTPEDLKKKGLKTLTAITVMDAEIKKLGRRMQAVLDGRLIDLHLLTVINPLSPVSESYRRLRTSIHFRGADRKCQAILVTSPNPNEGKSTTASNLAITFAQDDRTTLLIDADLRKPSIHNELGFEREPGLSDVLYDGVHISTAIKNTGIENLDVLTAGTISSHPSEAIGSNKFEKLLETLRSRYDVLIFDSPPILAVTDSSILSTLTDGIVLVVESGGTRLDTLERSVELVQGTGGNVLGVVLNKFDLRRAYGAGIAYYREKHYAYGYGIGYGSKENNAKQQIAKEKV